MDSGGGKEGGRWWDRVLPYVKPELWRTRRAECMNLVYGFMRCSMLHCYLQIEHDPVHVHKLVSHSLGPRQMCSTLS